MSLKNLLIIIALSTVCICFGIVSIYLNSRIQNALNHNSMLEEKISEYGTQINDLKNDIEFYANTPKDPFYEDYKRRISKIIERDIDTIVSEEPWSGGKWIVTGIIFINPSLVRVEFEDGHNAFESDIRIIIPDEKIHFEKINDNP